jgi:hypothetical protein
MFNCLPGAMLKKGHTHQWRKGFSCGRVHSQHNPRMTASHRVFNPGAGRWAKLKRGTMRPNTSRGRKLKFDPIPRSRSGHFEMQRGPWATGIINYVVAAN